MTATSEEMTAPTPEEIVARYGPELVAEMDATVPFQAAFSIPGGEVLVSASEFPANTYPWPRPRRRAG